MISLDCPGCGTALSYGVAPWIMREVRGPHIGRYYIWAEDPAENNPDHICEPGSFSDSN
jgi:hypothetical protein